MKFLIQNYKNVIKLMLSYSPVCIKECINSLTQLGLGNSMEDWVMNFGVQISFEALTPTKTGF